MPHLLKLILLISLNLFISQAHSETLATTQTDDKSLLFGSVAMDIPAVMYQRLSPLTEYLSKKMGVPISLKLAHNMGKAIENTIDGSVDITYLTPVAYIKAHEKSNTRLVAKTITKGKGFFKLMIVVKDSSPITSIDQLVGKSFAFGDKAALLQRAVVVGAGIPLEKLGNYEFLNYYDNIVRGVLNDDFDAGILKDTMAYKWKDKGIRILYQSGKLPPYNISVSKNVSEKTLAKLQSAFLELDANNPRHLKVIKSVDKKYNGFASTQDSDYDIVRNLIKPFE